MNTVTVEVVIHEGFVEVHRFSIRYFEGQPYTVSIATPDGVDTKTDRTAGKDTVSA